MLRAALMLLAVIPALACTTTKAGAQEGPDRDKPRQPMPPPPPPDQQPPQEEMRRKEKELITRIEELERAKAEAKDDEQRQRIDEKLNQTRGELEHLRAIAKDMAGRPPQQQPMSPEEFQKIMEFAKEFEPQAYQRIQGLPQDQQMRHAFELRRPMMELQRLKERNPEEYQRRVDMSKLEREALETAKKMRESADETERGKLKGQLLETLSKLFDLREQARAKEIEELERKVAELKKTLEKRKTNKDKIIEKRAQEMLGPEYEW